MKSRWRLKTGLGGWGRGPYLRGGGRQRRLDDVDDPVDGRNVPLQQQPLVHQLTALQGNDTRVTAGQPESAELKLGVVVAERRLALGARRLRIGRRGNAAGDKHSYKNGDACWLQLKLLTLIREAENEATKLGQALLRVLLSVNNPSDDPSQSYETRMWINEQTAGNTSTFEFNEQFN